MKPKSRILLWVVILALALSTSPAALAQSLEGLVYEGTLYPSHPYVGNIHIRLSFQAGGVLAWELWEWEYYDEEDEYTYTFPPLSDDDDTYTFNGSQLNVDVTWTGDVSTYEDSLYRCERFEFQSPSGGFTVDQDLSGISGSFLFGGRFCYGSSCWTDRVQEAGTLSLGRVEPTPTATSPPPPPTSTPTPSRTPTVTPTPEPRPTARHPGFDGNDDSVIDADDLLLFMQDWHEQPGHSGFDINGDSILNDEDLMPFALDWQHGVD